MLHLITLCFYPCRENSRQAGIIARFFLFLFSLNCHIHVSLSLTDCTTWILSHRFFAGSFQNCKSPKRQLHLVKQIRNPSSFQCSHALDLCVECVSLLHCLGEKLFLKKSKIFCSVSSYWIPSAARQQSSGDDKTAKKM